MANGIAVRIQGRIVAWRVARIAARTSARIAARIIDRIAARKIARIAAVLQHGLKQQFVKHCKQPQKKLNKA